MKRFFIRKIFPYDPTFRGKYSKYQGYSHITLKKASPNIEEELNIEIPNISIIFNSSLKRGTQTASFIKKRNDIKTTKKLPSLNEITFNLEKLISEEEFLQHGSKLVRERFTNSFVKNNLTESNLKIKRRIVNLLKILSKLPQGNYILISHSFFMKILEVYLNHNELFENPEILKKYFDISKKTFEFGEGFNFELE